MRTQQRNRGLLKKKKIHEALKISGTPRGAEVFGYATEKSVSNLNIKSVFPEVPIFLQPVFPNKIVIIRFVMVM